MKRTIAGILGGFMGLAAMTSSAATTADSVTYDFTGTVTFSDGIFGDAKVGSIVTGTYTIDFGAYNPSSSTLPVVENGDWSYANEGGSFSRAPLQSALVFSSTLSGGGGVSYHSTISGTFDDTSEVTGGTGAVIPYSLSMDELALPTNSIGTGSAVTLEGNTPVWTAKGLPNLAAANLAKDGMVATYEQGLFGFSQVEDELEYNINSIKLVKSAPELDPASMTGALTLLLGALAVARGRRSNTGLA